MRCGLLYSAGKDSTLAALLLDPFYDVTLVTATFGVVDPAPAREAAAETAGSGGEHRASGGHPDGSVGGFDGSHTWSGIPPAGC